MIITKIFWAYSFSFVLIYEIIMIFSFKFWNSKDLSSTSWLNLFCFFSGTTSLLVLKSFLITSLDLTNYFPWYSSVFICFSPWSSIVFICFTKRRICKLSLFYHVILIKSQYFFTCNILIFINFSTWKCWYFCCFSVNTILQFFLSNIIIICHD